MWLAPIHEEEKKYVWKHFVTFRKFSKFFNGVKRWWGRTETVPPSDLGRELTAPPQDYRRITSQLGNKTNKPGNNWRWRKSRRCLNNHKLCEEINKERTQALWWRTSALGTRVSWEVMALWHIMTVRLNFFMKNKQVITISIVWCSAIEQQDYYNVLGKVCVWRWNSAKTSKALEQKAQRCRGTSSISCNQQECHNV